MNEPKPTPDILTHVRAIRDTLVEANTKLKHESCAQLRNTVNERLEDISLDIHKVSKLKNDVESLKSTGEQPRSQEMKRARLEKEYLAASGQLLRSASIGITFIQRTSTIFLKLGEVNKQRKIELSETCYQRAFSQMERCGIECDPAKAAEAVDEKILWAVSPAESKTFREIADALKQATVFETEAKEWDATIHSVREAQEIVERASRQLAAPMNSVAGHIDRILPPEKSK